MKSSVFKRTKTCCYITCIFYQHKWLAHMLRATQVFCCCRMCVQWAMNQLTLDCWKVPAMAGSGWLPPGIFRYVQEISSATFKGNSWMLIQSSRKWWATLHSKARLYQLWFVVLWFSNAYPLLHCHVPVTVNGKRKCKLVPSQKPRDKKAKLCLN